MPTLAPDLPSTMRAMVIDHFGAPDLFHEQQMPMPTCAETDLLVAVRACAVNPVDCRIRQDGFFWPRTFPDILGFDISGVVCGFGSKVKGFALGDEVFGIMNLLRKGCNAEYAVVDYRDVAHKPKGITHEEAATLPVAALTAWHALIDRACVQPGQTVFINAGAGGVGHFAIQIAKKEGCRVITSAGRPESIEFCKQLGADLVIDYTKENIAEVVKRETGGHGADMFLDAVGGDALISGMEALAPNGKVVAIVRSRCEDICEHLYMKNATLHYEFVLSYLPPERQFERSNTLRKIAKLVEGGVLKPHINRVFKLSELAEAHIVQESGHVLGKLIVQIVS